ncbi:MAG: helix-turn-helix transcriptional regulator [Bosea sp.]|uniref:AraC family transcriptional regulator n=1 Tax=Bosea sp. (in: a-proteobacteria) TaxID=1871050 RepID=UPI001ACD629E|nr:helix-turn-helix transcriptional regulator [Bosea sp. (in: a-proteobacteria)]MBN9453773.1 helix-turn-helix transcriptional regulator [Bosea sp. (in: a-proteobacteria)]
MRSESEAYQTVPRAVAVMPKSYPAGASTGWHSHPRAQLLYATAGVTLVRAEDGTWVLPARHALWIPPRLSHEVRMHGAVSMCSAYIAPEAVDVLPTRCRVLEVSPLLASALEALAVEPLLYDEARRGGHLAALILDEIARAPETALTLPLPRDERLRRICESLLKDPGSSLDIDGWAERAGASRRTLTRGFRAETGLSFGDWRARLRVLRALTMASDGAPPHQIASAVGYADQRGLRTAARRVLGRTRLSL